MSEPATGDRPRAADSSSDDVVGRVLRGAGELVEYLGHCLHAKTDAAKLRASEDTINTGGLATTFPRGQPVRAMSEVELLAREAASARRAMDATLREIVGAPPGRDGWRVWAGAHPFLLVSGAAVAGALAARFVSPRGGNGHRQGHHPDDGLTAVLKDIGKD